MEIVNYQKNENHSNRIIIYTLCMISIMFFNDFIRRGMYQFIFHTDSNIADINIFFLAVLLIIFIRRKYREKIKAGIVILVFSMTYWLVIIQKYNHSPNNVTLLLILLHIIPLTMTGIKLNQNDIKTVFQAFLKVVNILAVIMVTNAIIDYLTNGSIQKYLLTSNMVSDGIKQFVVYNSSVYGYRYVSIWGHPLYNSFIFLCFFSLNMIRSKYFKEFTGLNKYLVIIISMVGIALCSSKAGILIWLALFMLSLNTTNKKIIYYFVAIIIIYFIYSSAFFQNTVMTRINEGLQYENFTSGRNTLLMALINGRYQLPDFFVGGGYNYSRYISGQIGIGALNFEYPLIMFAYDYGILFTLCMYGILFIRPIIILVKNRTYFLLFNFLMLAVFINGYNSITNLSDTLAVVCFISFLFSNISENISNNDVVNDTINL